MAEDGQATAGAQRIQFDDAIAPVTSSTRAGKVRRLSEHEPKEIAEDVERAREIAQNDLHQSRKQVCTPGRKKRDFGRAARF